MSFISRGALALSALVLLSIAALCAPSSSLVAQPLDEDEDRVPDVVVVGPLLEEAAEDETGFVARIELAPGAAAGAALAELLAEAPGVSVRAYGGALQPRRIVMRGASAEQVLVTLEGIRLNSVSSGGFDLSLLPTSAIAEAALLRGAGALTHGSGAEGGVVSLWLPSASKEGGDGGFSRLAVGRFGTGIIEGGLWAMPSAGLDVRVGLSLQRTEGDFDFVDDQGTDHTRANNDAEQASGFASVGVDIKGGTLKLVQFTGHTERGAPGPSEFPKQFAGARFEDTLVVTGLVAEWPWLLESESVALSVDARIGHRHQARGYRNPTALLGGQGFESENVEDEVSPRLAAHLDVGEHTTATLMLDARHESLTRSVNAIEQSHERTILAVTLLDATRLWSERLRLLGGVRYEADVEGGASAWVPKLGVSFEPLDALGFAANIARSFRIPSFDELYLRSEFVRGDATLEPEIALQGDLGIVTRPLPWWRMEVVGFWIEHERLILFVPSNAIFYQARNLEGARSLGVEASARINPWRFLTLEGNYTWTRARFAADPQDPLPGRPEHEASLRLTLRGWGVEGEGSAQYIGARFLDSFGNREEEGRWWLAMTLRWQATPQWLLSARVDNLLDIRDAVDALQQPLPGLQIMGTVTWTPFVQ